MDSYKIKVLVSSNIWYETFGNLNISVEINYWPQCDTVNKIIKMAQHQFLNDTKGTIMYDLINHCFLIDDTYTICNGSMPSLEQLKTNKAIVYICKHDNICVCNNYKCNCDNKNK